MYGGFCFGKSQEGFILAFFATVLAWQAGWGMSIGRFRKNETKIKLVKNKDFDYYIDNYKLLKEKYGDKYVAINEEKVVASGDDFGEVYNEARSKGVKRPFMAKINKKQIENM